MGLQRPRSISAHAATVATFATTLAFLGSAWAGPRVGDNIVQAKVISSTPVIGQVTVPRRACFDELRHEPPRSSGAGALLGAIAGGAMGNAVGKGSGNVLATGLGIFGGAILGDHIQNDGRQGSTRTVRRCEEQASVENRVVAYTVVYEYAGQRHSTQLSREPGRTIPVQVTVTPVLSDDDERITEQDDSWEDQTPDDGYEVAPAYDRRHRRHQRDWY